MEREVRSLSHSSCARSSFSQDMGIGRLSVRVVLLPFYVAAHPSEFVVTIRCSKQGLCINLKPLNIWGDKVNRGARCSVWVLGDVSL